MDQIKRDINTIADVALQINGLAYKINQEKTISDDKMKRLNSLTDIIDEKTKAILQNLSSVEKDHSSLKSHLENLKKGIAAQKSKAAASILLSDTYSEQKKRLKEEVNSLTFDLSNLRGILNSLSFDEGFASTSTPLEHDENDQQEETTIESQTEVDQQEETTI